MSNIAPEGVPAPMPDAPAAPAPVAAPVPLPAPVAPAPASAVSEAVQVVSGGLSAAHVAGGGVGGFLGGVVAEVLEKYAGVHLSLPDAAYIGSISLAAGVGIGHLWAKGGLFGLFRMFLHGGKA